MSTLFIRLPSIHNWVHGTLQNTTLCRWKWYQTVLNTIITSMIGCIFLLILGDYRHVLRRGPQVWRSFCSCCCYCDCNFGYFPSFDICSSETICLLINVKTNIVIIACALCTCQITPLQSHDNCSSNNYNLFHHN